MTVYKSDGKLKSNIYLPPEILKAAYDESMAEGKCSRKLIECFYKIAEELETQFNLKNDIDKRACINYAVAEMWRKWDKFDETVSPNLFSFYTTVIYNDLRISHNKRVKHKDKFISLDALFDTSKDS